MSRGNPIQAVFVPASVLLWLLPGLYILINLLDPIVGRGSLLLHGIGFMAAMGGALGYGLSRTAMLYPGANEKYATWLALTPWRPGRSLPLGPSHVWWQDLLALAVAGTCLAVDWWFLEDEILTILSIASRAYIGHGLAWLVVAFTLGYCASAGQALWRLRQWTEPVLLAWVCPLISICVRQPGALVGIAILMLLIANVGVLRSLRRFPWPSYEPLIPKRSWLGWPASRLGRTSIPRLSVGVGTGLGLLAGWWAFAVVTFFDSLPGNREKLDHFNVTALCLVLAAGAGLFRLGMYIGGYRWPLGIFARVFTGRLIIPRYDVALVAPMVTVFVGVAMPMLCDASGMPPVVALSASIAVIVATAIELGPSYRAWCLTGEHRIVPGGFSTDPKSVTHPLGSDIPLRAGVR